MSSDGHDWLRRIAPGGCRLLREHHGYETLPVDWSVSRPDGLAEHLIYLPVTGGCAGTVAGRPVELIPGTVLWVPPRTRFALASRGPTALTLYRIRLAVPSTPAAARPFLLVRNGWALRPVLDALVTDLDRDDEFAELRSSALLTVLLATLLRPVAGPGGDPAAGEVPGLSPDQRRAVERYADEHLAGRPSVAELAAVAGLSAAEFRRRFGASYQLSARSWLLCRRIHAAARRLDETAEPVGAVASAYGYTDVFLFSRQFKSVLGLSPRAWRDRRGQPMAAAQSW